MESQTYRTLIGCCETPADELIVEALYERRTVDLATAAAELLNARGYRMSGAQLLEELDD